jgi:hypothetical protein
LSSYSCTSPPTSRSRQSTRCTTTRIASHVHRDLGHRRALLIGATWSRRRALQRGRALGSRSPRAVRARQAVRRTTSPLGRTKRSELEHYGPRSDDRGDDKSNTITRSHSDVDSLISFFCCYEFGIPHVWRLFFLPSVLYCTIVMVEEGSIRIVLNTVDTCTVSYTKSYMNERDAQRSGDLQYISYVVMHSLSPPCHPPRSSDSENDPGSTSDACQPCCCLATQPT